jgi:hypothetical protein
VTTTETATVRSTDIVDHAAPPRAGVATPPPAPADRDPGPDPAEAQSVAAAGPRTSRVVLRHVDPVSVLKLSLVFYLCVCGVLLVAGVVLWLGAAATGVVGNLESFIRDTGFNDFRFAPVALFRAVTLIGLIIVVAGTLANLLLATLFNLMSDVVGGVRVTLAEDVHPGRGR